MERKDRGRGGGGEGGRNRGRSERMEGRGTERREGELEMVSVKSRAPLLLTCACSSGPPPPSLHRAPPPAAPPSPTLQTTAPEHTIRTSLPLPLPPGQPGLLPLPPGQGLPQLPSAPLLVCHLLLRLKRVSSALFTKFKPTASR